MKFFFIRAIIVNGIKDARNKSAHAKLTKYLLFVKRIGPREPNMTINAALFPKTARRKINDEIPVINHSISNFDEEFVVVMFDDVETRENRNVKFERFCREMARQVGTNIFP